MRQGIVHKLREMFGGGLRISREQGPAEEFERGRVAVRCDRIWESAQLLEGEWDALLARWTAGTTFHCETWVKGGLLASLRPGSLRLITARIGGKLVAGLPLAVGGTGFLESAGYAVSDYLDPMVLGEEAEVWGGILGLLGEVWDGRVRGVVLHNVREGASCRRILPEVAGEAGFVYEEKVADHTLILRLPGSWEAYLQSIDGHERKEMRRKIRKAQDQSNAELMVVGAGQISTAMDLIEAGNPGKRLWLRENVRPVLERVGPALILSNRMQILMLSLDNIPAACLIEFPSTRGPLLYNSGFDPGLRHLSPGMVTFGLAIQRAIEAGCEVFDLLRGREAYKYKLGAIEESVYEISLHR